MKLLKIALATAAIAGFATTAAAQDSGAYGTIGADFVSVDAADFVTATARLGYGFTENFGVEGQGSIGIAGDAGLSIKSSFAAFAVARAPISDQFSIFGRVGYHTSKVGLDDFGSESFDGVAFGGGVQYNFTNVDGFRLEYTNLDGDGGSADVFGAAYVRNF